MRIQHTRTLLPALLTIGLVAWSLGAFSPDAASQQGLNAQRITCADGRTPIRSLPFTIDQCGSYFLADCLTGVAGQDGITIDADDVTLDLNGFTLSGVTGSLDGITATQSWKNVRIENGSIDGWGGDGIDGFGLRSSSYEDLRASNNTGVGISIGTGGAVRGSSAEGNGGDGIVVGFGGIVIACNANGNGGIGIYGQIGAIATGATIQSSTTRANGGGGILSGDGSTVSGCTAILNSPSGISVGPGSAVRGCAVTFNGGDGIVAFDSLVQGNSARGNQGLDINAQSSTVIENH